MRPREPPRIRGGEGGWRAGGERVSDMSGQGCGDWGGRATCVTTWSRSAGSFGAGAAALCGGGSGAAAGCGGGGWVGAGGGHNSRCLAPGMYSSNIAGENWRRAPHACHPSNASIASARGGGWVGAGAGDAGAYSDYSDCTSHYSALSHWRLPGLPGGPSRGGRHSPTLQTSRALPRADAGTQDRGRPLQESSSGERVLVRDPPAVRKPPPPPPPPQQQQPARNPAIRSSLDLINGQAACLTKCLSGAVLEQMKAGGVSAEEQAWLSTTVQSLEKQRPKPVELSKLTNHAPVQRPSALLNTHAQTLGLQFVTAGTRVFVCLAERPPSAHGALSPGTKSQTSAGASLQKPGHRGGLLDLGLGELVEYGDTVISAVAQRASALGTFPVLWQGALLCEGSGGDSSRAVAPARASGLAALHVDGDNMDVMLHVVCVCVCARECVRVRSCGCARACACLT